MKRHTITLGASTTSGGKIISASSNGRINGIPIALEGDLVICPACKSQGKIACTDPRIPERWNGKNVALENDLCLCGCPVPPKLVPIQASRYQELGELKVEMPTGRTQNKTSSPQVSAISYNEKFVLIDDDTDLPVPNAEYAIRRATGHLEYGITDSNGETHLLAATAESESVDIYV